MSFDYVTLRGGKLSLNGTQFQFVSFNIPNYFVQEDPWRRTTAFEQEDLLQTLAQIRATVARTYTFSFPKSALDSSKHIIIISGYGTGDCDWQLNELLMTDFDRGLYLAQQYGIRLIIPLIDYYSYWGGIEEFANMFGLDKGSFFNNPAIRTQWFKFVSLILKRNNTITGKLYFEEPIILGFETINEGPGNNSEWTLETAAHIKSIDGNHLLIDGTYGLYGWNTDVLKSDLVDIVSNHYYPVAFTASSYTITDFLAISIISVVFLCFITTLATLKFCPNRIPVRLMLTEHIPEMDESSLITETPNDDAHKENEVDFKVKVKTFSWWLLTFITLSSFGTLLYLVLFPILIRGLDFASRIAIDCSSILEKPLLVGEFGLAPVKSLSGAINYIPQSCSIGGLVWSLRGHSELGGFHVHNEIGGYWSYHFPGFPSSSAGIGSDEEMQVVSIVSSASKALFALFALPASNLPKPPIFINSNTSFPIISWKGCSGCQNYTLYGSNSSDHISDSILASGIQDNFPSGMFNYNFSTIGLGNFKYLLIVGIGKFGETEKSSPLG